MLSTNLYLPMHLPTHSVQEFKELYEAEFQEEIDWSEAELMAHELMRLYETIWEAMLNEAAHKNSHSRNAPPTT